MHRRALISARSAALAAVLLAGGCKSFSQRPVAENVVQARQISLQGLQALEAGRPDDAEQLFAKAIKICPVDERARCRYAELLWRRGEFDLAVRQMDEAIRLSAGDASLRVQLGQMHLARGDAARALSQATAVLQTDHRCASAWALQGDAQRAGGAWSEALESYHRALALEPHYPAVQLATADVYSQLQLPLRSLATLRALEDDYGPHQAPADLCVREGLALKQLGRFDTAAEVLATAIRRGANQADVYFELADAHARAGDVPNAELSITAALDREPQHGRSQQLRTALRGQTAIPTQALR